MFILENSKSLIYKYLFSIGIETTGEITLKGDVSFWLFLRSMNLDENTVAIKISKESFTSKVVASIGTWVESMSTSLKYNSNNCNSFLNSEINEKQEEFNSIFKMFTRQQLIDYNKVDNISKVKKINFIKTQ